MRRIDYFAKHFTEEAWSAIDNADSLEIAIPENLAARAEKALVAYHQYSELRKGGVKSWSLLLRIAWFGMATPVLWGVVNHAELRGFSVASFWIKQHQLVIRIWPEKQSGGKSEGTIGVGVK